MNKIIMMSLFVLLLAGCSFPTAGTVTEVQCPTQLPPPLCEVTEFTPTPQVVVEVTPSPLYQVMSVKVNVDVINFRTGPGTTFPISNTYAKNSVFQVYAKEPGDGWIFVRTANDQYGWVDARFVDTDLDLSIIPAIIPPNVYIISGKLLDQKNEPAQYVQFAIVQGSGVNAPRTDAQTNSAGLFYAYLPNTSTGTWTVSFVAYGCGYGFVGNCDRSGTVNPEYQNITLPQTNPLQFTWNGN